MSSPAAAAARTKGRGFQPLRDLPVVAWLVVLVAVTLVHPLVPTPRWLMLHLLLLGAVSHAIHVWSTWFADTLLHSAPSSTTLRNRQLRLGMHNGGAVGVVLGSLLDRWPVLLAGAMLVGAAAAWHAGALVAQMRGALGARFSATVEYYGAAACFLPVGATLGVLLARDVADPLHTRLLHAHITVNLLGWVGLTVLGTLLTLWPTMLRTKLAPGAERASRRGLPVLLTAVLVTAAGALVGLPRVTAVGVAGYLAGTAVLAVPFVDAARRKPPRTFAAWSVAAAAGWLTVVLAVLAVVLASAPDVPAAARHVEWAVPFLAAGFAAQVLLGALSYLVPVALGGGPVPVRVASAVLDRGSAARVVTVNAGLVVLALPSPSLVQVVTSTVVLAALAAFLPLLVLALRAHRKAKRPLAGAGAPNRASGPGRPAGQLRGLATTGLVAVVLAVAVGVALDPAALSAARTADADGGVAATGETTTVQVEAADMRFTPAKVTVPAGNRLVIEVANTDVEDVHDLVIDSGERTGRLAPGESATIDVGVVGRDLTGWCSVVGHRQMGMTFEVDVAGATTPGADNHAAAHQHEDGGDPVVMDPMATPAPDFRARDADLPPLDDRQVRRVTLTVQEVEREVAPGYTQTLWTYDGTVPGPVLHGRVGDTFVVTLVNDGSIGHSIDFHAGALAPDRPMRTIPPGESLVYRFTATKAGTWMYHCSTMPMSAHLGNGMYGAVVIEPPRLPEVDRSYVLVQSEYHLGENGSHVDTGKLAAEAPDAVVFNGYANQYVHDPLPARAGDRVRVWLLDAGPNRSTSFHVVGGQFDTVYVEGGYLLRPPAAGGAQALALGPAQGGFVELTLPEPGTYPFLTHAVVDAERGARGLFRVR